MKTVMWVALIALAASGCGSERCTTDGDCPGAEYCAADRHCSDDPLYETCIYADDCESGRALSCIMITTPAPTAGSFCSQTCSETAPDCPDGHSGMGTGCYAIGLDPEATFVCYERCTLDSDCEIGSLCYPFNRSDGLRDYVCLPDQ